MIQIGDKLHCIFNEPLPGKDYAPALKKDGFYDCKGIHLDSKGNPHIDVGLPLELNYVKSFETDEDLPKTTHWCHPNRFIIVEPAPITRFADEGVYF